MNNIETHYYFQNDSVETPDKEIWSNGCLTHSFKDGHEEEYVKGTKENSPFKDDKPYQAVYYFACGSTVQHNLSDDSFYFRLADQTMSAYIDGKLTAEFDERLFAEHIEFADGLLAQ